MPMSARFGAAPVPSIKVPFRITISQFIMEC
jgi:hypothetical protein